MEFNATFNNMNLYVSYVVAVSFIGETSVSTLFFLLC